MKLHLVTFADGSPTRREAAHRLAAQANEAGWFASVTPLHLEDLHSLSETWFSTHQAFLSQNPRGLGYWIWKPFLILERLKIIPEDDCLVYSDAGTEISHHGTARFQEYVDLVWRQGMLAFYHPGEPMSKWTKGDLLAYFGISSTSPLLQMDQVWAGLLFLRNTPSNLVLLSHWAELCVARNYSLVNDAASHAPNPPGFKEHRHDQAILSLLLRTAPRPSIIPDESYQDQLWKQGTYPHKLPFHSFRNPTGSRMIPSPAIS